MKAPIRALLATLLASALAAPSALAAGGALVKKTDGEHDNVVYTLGGSGNDRFITEYTEADFGPGAIVCGARLVVWTAGAPNQAPIRIELRTEDFTRPGFPLLTQAGLLAAGDAE